MTIYKKVFSLSLLAMLAVGCGKDNKTGSTPPPAPAPAPVSAPAAVSNLNQANHKILAPHLQNSPLAQQMVNSYNSLIEWRQKLTPATEGRVFYYRDSFLQQNYTLSYKDPSCFLKFICVQNTTPVKTNLSSTRVCVKGYENDLQTGLAVDGECINANFSTYSIANNQLLAKALSFPRESLYLWGINEVGPTVTIWIGSQNQIIKSYRFDRSIHSSYNPVAFEDYVNRTGYTTDEIKH